MIYADSSEFDNWTDWVNDSLNSPAQRELDNAAIFSNYVLKLKCELNVWYNACGIKSSAKGAFLIESNEVGEISAVEDTSTVVSNTYVMTKA